MPQIDYRANLSSSIFPMTLAKAGRSVIASNKLDHHYDKRVDSPGDQTKAVGIPQAIYMENVFPTPDGFQSVGFKPIDDLPDPVSIVESVKIATNEESTVIEDDIDITDAGDEYSEWTKSALNRFNQGNNFVPPSISAAGSWWHAEVTNPGGTAYVLKDIRFAYDNDPDPPPVMQRNMGLSVSDNITFSVDVEFQASELSIAEAVADAYEERHFTIGIATTATGAGVKVVYSNITNTLRLSNYSAYTTEGRPTDYVGSVSPTDIDTEYRVEGSFVRDSDGNLTVTVEMFEGVTSLGSVSGTYLNAAVIHGDWFGLSRACTRRDVVTDITTETDTDLVNTAFIATAVSGSSPLGTYAPQRTMFTNISVQGVISDLTSTIVSGIESIDIAFSDDYLPANCSWSPSDSDTWENNPVATSAGNLEIDSSTEFSTATVRGICYVCLRRNGLTKIYSLSIGALNTLTFTDVTDAIEDTFSTTYNINEVISISGSFNYLLLHTATVIFWSSTTTPTDFAASLVSGAGSETPGNLKGDITFLKEHVSGFFIYTTKNVVFAAYTGNRAYPWKFREIGGSGGFNYATQVSGDTNAAVHFGLNNARFIQSLSPSESEIQSPEVTDFLERVRKWDIFNYSTNVFTTFVDTPGNPTSLISATDPRIWFVLDRYILIPYGIVSGAYTYCIVFDTLLRRYGKLKITFHTITTDEQNIRFYNYTTLERHRLYFDMNYRGTGGETWRHQGVLVLGKFEISRGRNVQIEQVEVETASTSSAGFFTAHLLPSYDGKTFESAVALTQKNDITDSVAVYPAHTQGQNVSLLLKGAFDLTTIQLIAQDAGKAFV